MLKWYQYRYCIGGKEYAWIIAAESPKQAKVEAEKELTKELGARKYIPGEVEEADEEVVKEWEQEFNK